MISTLLLHSSINVVLELTAMMFLTCYECFQGGVSAGLPWALTVGGGRWRSVALLLVSLASLPFRYFISSVSLTFYFYLILHLHL